MKFQLTTAVLGLFATLAAAQNVAIRSPPPQSTFTPGEQFVVDVVRPVRISHAPTPPPHSPPALAELAHRLARRLRRHRPPQLRRTLLNAVVRRHRLELDDG